MKIKELDSRKISDEDGCKNDAAALKNVVQTRKRR